MGDDIGFFINFWPLFHQLMFHRSSMDIYKMSTRQLGGAINSVSISLVRCDKYRAITRVPTANSNILLEQHCKQFLVVYASRTINFDDEYLPRDYRSVILAILR